MSKRISGSGTSRRTRSSPGDDKAGVVETVPGWTHDVTNVSADELVVMLWANEVFDRARQDTFACSA